MAGNEFAYRFDASLHLRIRSYYMMHGVYDVADSINVFLEGHWKQLQEEGFYFMRVKFFAVNFHIEFVRLAID